MRNMLFEDWGNLTRVSPRVVQNLSYHDKYKMGKGSKVEIFRGTPEQVWDKIYDKSDVEKGELLYVVVRYEQDDILQISESYDGLNFYNGEFLEMIPDYNDGYNYLSQTSARAVSGLKKCIKFVVAKIHNYVEKEKTNIFGIPKTATEKDILARINYQFIYSDLERRNTQHERSIIQKSNSESPYIDKDGKKVLSNYAMNNNNLRNRLKDYVNSKLPSFDNPADIPTDLQKFNENSAFKLYGCKYKYSKWKPSRYEANTLSFIQGKSPDYLTFSNEETYSSNFIGYPDKIVFRLYFNPKSKDIEVTDVGYELRRKEYQDIFGKEPTDVVSQIKSSSIDDDDYIFAPIETMKQYIEFKKSEYKKKYG